MENLLNIIRKTFTYNIVEDNIIEVFFGKDFKELESIIYILSGFVLLALSSFFNMLSDIFLYFFVVINLSFGYYLYPLFDSITPDNFMKKYGILYILSVLLFLIIIVYINSMSYNIISILLLCFIIENEYKKYLTNLDNISGFFIEFALFISTFLILLFVFYDFISPFLFCITGVSLLFSGIDYFNQLNSDDKISSSLFASEYFQMAFIIFFFFSFIMQIRAKDAKFYLKNITKLKKYLKKKKPIK